MRITGHGIWGPPKDHDEAVRVLRRSAELGVTFIDTADSYGPFVSEDLIREALHDGSGYGDVVIATKGGFTRTGPNEWAALGRKEYLRQCIRMSLRRLGVDRIDLWQLAQAMGLPPWWLNEQASAYVSAQHDEGKREVFDHPGIRVMAASPEHVFAMKAFAARSRDEDDLRALAAIIGISTIQAALEICGRFFPDEELPSRSRAMLEDIFDLP
jgi:aryl-alcohol dehydrogenase-like predicted oxidoreductase